MNILKALKNLVGKGGPDLDPVKVKEFQEGFRRATHTQKSQPTSSQVHVPSTGREDKILIKTKDGIEISVKGHDQKNLQDLETSLLTFLHEEGVEKDMELDKFEDTQDMMRAKAADLVTFSPDVKGAVCSNCQWVKGDVCTNPKVDQKLTSGPDKMCCSLWDHPGTVRAWENVDKADLTAQGRDKIKDSNFGLPKERKYPIHDIDHARNALARVSQHGSEEEKAKVRAAVYRKYPKLKKIEKGGVRRIAKVAIIYQGSLLMGKRRDNGKWTIPGGHCDYSETMKEGALREVMEETGIELDPKFLFPLTEICHIEGKNGDWLEVQGWTCELATKISTTMKQDPDAEVERWKWVDCSTGLPEEIEGALHVPKKHDKVLNALGVIRKSAVDADSDTDMLPGIDNLEGGMLKAAAKSIVGDDSNQNYSDLSSMKDIISGMDYELANGFVDEEDAREAAIFNLAEDPDYYNRKYWEAQSREDLIDNNVTKDTEENEESPLSNMGFNIDLGSGTNREPGHLGFDLYPYDYGTIPHDLNLGIPLEDNTVQKVQMINAYHHMDLDDPKALLSEIHRVLMPGGQFVYEGPNEIYNYPDWTTMAPGMVLVDDQSVEKAEGDDGEPIVRQKFERIATPDPATANDAEPRTGISQYDMLPADALLAADAIGYQYSDATSSGRGNRLHGYPSQGALLQKETQAPADPVEMACMDEASGYHVSDQRSEQLANAKQMKQAGGPGSGPAPGGAKAKSKLSQADKYRMIRGESVGKSRTDAQVEKILKSEFVVPILKASTHKQIVYGVVLEPNTVDSQEDFMDPEEIEKAAHRYLIKSRVVGGEHTKPILSDPVESFIAPQDFEMSGQNGPQVVKKGSWVLGVKVHDPKEWQKVLNGDYTGFSVGGFGEREHQH